MMEGDRRQTIGRREATDETRIKHGLDVTKQLVRVLSVFDPWLMPAPAMLHDGMLPL
jgi:hypothetical protein